MSEDAFGFETFRSVGERIEGERERRLESAKSVLTFGVNYLDAALGGIFANDLVLIGAKTGAGKTQLAMRIAMANALLGKRVHYFALEAEPDEIERRMKFAVMMEMAKHESAGQFRRSGYLNWYKGELDSNLDEYENRASREVAERYSSLHTFYRGSDFNGDQFERMVLAVQDQTDLVILDHLHYVDTNDRDDNRGYKTLVKQVRTAALSMGKPVILLAHVRKGDARSERLIPDIEDFHGTSDVPKISTKAIMLGAARDQSSGDPSKWPTYFAPVKCRVDGSRTRYVGLVNYDARSGVYDESFVLGQISGGSFVAIEENKLPPWAIPARAHQRSF